MKSLTSVFILIFTLNCAVFSQQSPFYAIGPKFENTHWLFTGEVDTLSGTWSILPPLNKPLVGVNSYYWPDSNKIFICGGIDTSALLETSCFFYNLNSNSYTPAAPLPDGRWSGKLVRVRDSLYLIGSIGTDFASPDGKVYKYSLNGNAWTIKSTIPVPKLEESAVCVYRDSLIITVGGSTDRFQGATSYVRLYNPWRDSWRTSFTSYAIPVTTAHAECKLIDSLSTIVVLGGFSAGNVDAFYKGIANVYANDSLYISWDSLQYTPFQQGIYRVSGGQMNDYYLFGPGRHDLATISQIWALRLSGADYLWTRLLPDIIDSTSNIPQIAVKPGTDTASLFFFGGYSNPVFSNQVKMLTITGSPIGIEPIKNTLPTSFKLYQNFPNPFNPSTKIRFDIAHSFGNNTPVKLIIYDILGREVITLVNKYLNAGTYEIQFDGSQFASGIYFYVISYSENFEVRKMVLLK